MAVQFAVRRATWGPRALQRAAYRRAAAAAARGSTSSATSFRLGISCRSSTSENPSRVREKICGRRVGKGGSVLPGQGEQEAYAAAAPRLRLPPSPQRAAAACLPLG